MGKGAGAGWSLRAELLTSSMAPRQMRCSRLSPSTALPSSAMSRCRRPSNSGLVVPWPRAVLVDTLLILAFAIQHSGMARVSFKRWSMRIVPPPIERSTYILCASLLLVLLYLLWCPIPTTVWTVRQPLLGTGITALFWAGWMVTLLAAAATNQLEMTGLRQILDARPGPAWERSDADDFGALPHCPASDLRRHSSWPSGRHRT